MHVGIISETQNVVKFYGVIKVMIIIGLVVAQIMILKYSLNKKQSQTFMWSVYVIANCTIFYYFVLLK